MILDDIAAATRLRVDQKQLTVSLEKMKAWTKSGSPSKDVPFEQALSAPGLSFICEVKKASPSKGVIVKDFPYTRIAWDYLQAGASAISVLTEPDFFQGDIEYLGKIARMVKMARIPLLCKDFIIDEYQIYEASLYGASAILLICALLDTERLSRYHAIAASLGLSCLVETHSEAEIASALEAGARIIGINNRDLKTFEVDLHTTARLRPCIPPGTLVVSESGIQAPDDIRFLRDHAIDAVLIGETLMRAPDKKRYLDELRSVC